MSATREQIAYLATYMYEAWVSQQRHQSPNGRFPRWDWLPIDDQRMWLDRAKQRTQRGER